MSHIEQKDRPQAVFLSGQHGKRQQDQKSNQIGSQEKHHKFADFRTGPPKVQLQGDETGQGCDGSAETADVDTGQQLLPVFGEGGQQHGSRHIADGLATAHVNKKTGKPDMAKASYAGLSKAHPNEYYQYWKEHIDKDPRRH